MANPFWRSTCAPPLLVGLTGEDNVPQQDGWYMYAPKEQVALRLAFALMRKGIIVICPTCRQSFQMHLTYLKPRMLQHSHTASFRGVNLTWWSSTPCLQPRLAVTKTPVKTWVESFRIVNSCTTRPGRWSCWFTTAVKTVRKALVAGVACVRRLMRK